MLVTAFLARRRARLKTPIIYECLDVHRLLTNKSLAGLIFRRAEGWFLKRCSRLVVSSPGFLRNHFEVHHKGRFRAVLIENKLAAGAVYGPRPSPAPSGARNRPLRIGWVGMLRCRRSFGLLLELSRQFKDEIRIVMRGKAASEEIPDFDARLREIDAEGRGNVDFDGPYRAPEDLAGIYGGLDLVWAGDFMEAGANSVWLLPNRIYEGGYYAIPPLAPAGTETARWIDEHGVGFTLEEDLTLTLPALIRQLAADRNAISQRRARLLNLDDSTFVAAPGELRELISDVLQDHPRRSTASLDQFSTRNARTSDAPARATRVAGE
jgi:succinoglycan biosynthesis protein ExoL